MLLLRRCKSIAETWPRRPTSQSCCNPTIRYQWHGVGALALVSIPLEIMRVADERLLDELSELAAIVDPLSPGARAGADAAFRRWASERPRTSHPGTSLSPRRSGAREPTG